MSPAGSRLEIGDLTVRLEQHADPLLRGVCAAARGGDVVGITGPSGSGKTTLLHTVAGLLPWHRPAEVTGLMRLDGEELGDLDPAQRAHLLATALDRIPPNAVLVADELGPVELRGGGHMPAVRKALASPALSGAIIVVRRHLVPSLLAALGAQDAVVVDLEGKESPTEAIVAALGGRLRRPPGTGDPVCSKREDAGVAKKTPAPRGGSGCG